ncbi:MAG: GAF domain-containing protein [Desulfobaccales bacterium]
MGKKLINVWLALALVLIAVAEWWACCQPPGLTTAAGRRGLILGTLVSSAILIITFCFFIRENKARAKGAAELQRADRTLKILGEAHQAMLWALDEADLHQEICRILVQVGGYRLAWVGRALADRDQAVIPLAHAGADDGYLAAAGLRWSEADQGREPFGTAVRTGSPCIIPRIQEDPAAGLWRTEALERGFASAAAFPLKIGEQPWGALALYAGDTEAFDADTVAMLGTLAQDLEYGVASLRFRLEHQRADQALRESEAQYRLLVNNLNHGLVMVNREHCFTFVNPRFCDLLGYSREDLVGHKVFEFFDRDNQEIIRDQLDRGEPGEQTPYEITWTRKDGAQIIVLITPIPAFEPDSPLNCSLCSVAVVTDITDRKRAEAQARLHLQSLRLLIAGVEKLAQIRDPEALVPETCRLVAEAFKTGLVCLARVESSGLIRPLYWTEEPAPCLDNLEIRLEDPVMSQGPVSQAIATGKPVLSCNSPRQEEAAPWAAAALRLGYRAQAVFPLTNEHRTFACLIIYADQPDFFTPERMDLLQAFAGIVAASMEHTRLSHEVENHFKRLQSLRQIALAISSSLDLRTTLDIVLDQVAARLQVDAATILLFNPRTSILEFGAARGFKSDRINQIQVSLDQGCAGSVALQQQPLYIPDLAAVRDKCSRANLFDSEGFVSYFGVPLLHQGQTKGIIEILHRSRFDADAAMREFVEALTGPAAIALDNATLFAEMQRSHQELSQAYEATLEGWAMALELRDFETKGHSQRVTGLTLKLARALGVTEAELAHIYRGALLHDIGKIAVPDSILLKEGPLTSEEWVIMRQHPIFAHDLLAPIAYLRPALDIPFCHHEKWDGSGYPMGLKGEDIPLAARIFSVVDVWDALGSDRPYRSAWPPDKIKAYLQKQAGKQFDPQIVEVFLERFLPAPDAPA